MAEKTLEERLSELYEKIDHRDQFFDKDLMDHFAGFIFKVPAGQGNIRITAEATGDMTLRVKIGNDDPIEKQLDGRRKVSS